MAAAPVLSSRQNPLVKILKDRRDDSSSGFLFLEGPHLIDEALKSRLEIETLVLSEKAVRSGAVDKARRKAERTLHVTESVFEALSDVRSPQGVLAFARARTWTWSDLTRSTPALLVILDGIQDPGNAASILRTAEAAGGAGVITTKETARLFSPRALRAAMGASLRLPILEHQPFATIVHELGKAGYSLLAAQMERSANAAGPIAQSLWAMDWKRPWALVLGQEGSGLSAEWPEPFQHVVSLPMKAPVESLNVAAAAAVLLYESRRAAGN